MLAYYRKNFRCFLAIHPQNGFFPSKATFGMDSSLEIVDFGGDFLIVFLGCIHVDKDCSLMRTEMGDLLPP